MRLLTLLSWVATALATQPAKGPSDGSDHWPHVPQAKGPSDGSDHWPHVPARASHPWDRNGRASHVPHSLPLSATNTAWFDIPKWTGRPDAIHERGLDDSHQWPHEPVHASHPWDGNERASHVPHSVLPSETTPSSNNGPCATPTLTAVTFNQREATNYGENVFLVGGISQLGNWDTSKAVPLSASKDANSNPPWYATVSLPTGSSFKYKYFKRSQDGATIEWESGPGRTYTVPGSCAGIATEHHSWR